MQEIQKIANIVERMKKRERATQKAKEDIQAILDWISKQVPDAVSGHRSQTEFYVKYDWWNGSNWRHTEGYAYFALHNGEATTKIDDFRTAADIVDFLYINLPDAIVALEEFLENISKMKTFEAEAKKIAKIKEALNI